MPVTRPDTATSVNTEAGSAHLAMDEAVRSDRIGFRDCLADHAHVASRRVFEGKPILSGAPLVTIAIPTYRRSELLAETVRSALAQHGVDNLEIIVVDNDPESGADALLARVPQIRSAHLRYFVNDENIGMFGNWNRCIELARGEWLTILNDDDLIDPDYLSLMLATLRTRPEIGGIICRKRYLDQRPDASSHENRGLKRLASRFWLEARFGGRQARRIGFDKLFWGGMLGNSAGFLFRRENGRQIGGFYPEEFPGADHWFFIRFAKLFGLWQHRAMAASVRIATNESAKPATLEAFVRDFYRMQRLLAGSEVPRWWLRFSPLMIARHRVEIRQFWHQDFTQEEVEGKLGLRLTRDRPWLLWTARAFLRGF